MHNQIASFRARVDARPCPATSGCCCCSPCCWSPIHDAQVLGYVVPTLAQEWAWTRPRSAGVQRQPVRPDRRFAAGDAAGGPLRHPPGAALLRADLRQPDRPDGLRRFPGKPDAGALRLRHRNGRGDAQRHGADGRVPPPRLRTDGHPGGLRFLLRRRRRRFRRRRLHGRLLAGRRCSSPAASPRCCCSSSSSCSCRSRCRACSATHRLCPPTPAQRAHGAGLQPPPAQADAEPAAAPDCWSCSATVTRGRPCCSGRPSSSA